MTQLFDTAGSNVKQDEILVISSLILGRNFVNMNGILIERWGLGLECSDNEDNPG